MKNALISSSVKTFYLDSMGCQMNKADAEKVAGLLLAEGWVEANSPSNVDLVLVNGCVVREKAEEKAVNRVKLFLNKSRGRKVALIGCAAEWRGEDLMNELPDLHLVLSSSRIGELPVLAETGGVALGYAEWSADRVERRRVGGIRAWIPVMRGCDHGCTFCVVPKTRGPQYSFPPSHILEDATQAIEDGYVELVLLGQRVSAYSYNGVSFASLVKQIAGLTGVKRIRFTAPYPADIGDDLLDVIAKEPVVENRLHLPLQSGSDRILRLMGRGYTGGEYLSLVEKVRGAIPDVGLSTDLIVGFPGETEADFLETLWFVENIQFDTAFTFAYSQRSGTPAATMGKQVGVDVKKDRLSRLVKAHHDALSERLLPFVGRDVDVLIEGTDKRDSRLWMGKMSNGRVVVIDGQYEAGSLVRAHVTGLRGHTLVATPAETPFGNETGLGEKKKA